MSIIWKDISSFRQGDKERIPTSFRAKVGVLTISVHRHIYFEKDEWLLSVEGFFDKKQLGKGTSDEAKEVAIALVKDMLENTLKEFE